MEHKRKENFFFQCLVILFIRNSKLILIRENMLEKTEHRITLSTNIARIAANILE